MVRIRRAKYYFSPSLRFLQKTRQYHYLDINCPQLPHLLYGLVTTWNSVNVDDSNHLMTMIPHQVIVPLHTHNHGSPSFSKIQNVAYEPMQPIFVPTSTSKRTLSPDIFNDWLPTNLTSTPYLSLLVNLDFNPGLTNILSKSLVIVLIFAPLSTKILARWPFLVGSRVGTTSFCLFCLVFRAFIGVMPF